MSDRRRVLLLVYPGFAELQVAAALDLLRERAALTVAAQRREPVRSEGGLAVMADATWGEVRGQRFDAVLVPGAVDLREAWQDDTLAALLAEAAQAATVVGAICGGPVLLHRAGLLAGRRWTTNFNAAQRASLGVPEAGWVDVDLVRDGPFVTARGHAHGRFALAVAEALGIDAAPLRRYVLQGAEPAPTGGPGPAFAALPEPGVVALDHLVLTVHDLRATIGFYTRALGMQEVTFGAGRKALAFGAQKINLHEAGREFEPKAQHPTPGSADLCFITDTPIEEYNKHLAALGIAVIEGPAARTGAVGPLWSIYVRDPDQNLIEIANRRN